MIIAITGASGYIGKHIESMLKNLGHNIISISRNHDAHSKTKIYSYQDLFSGKIHSRIDCFIHLASPNYDYSKDNSLELGITKLTEDILFSLKYYKCKKIIFFSSAKVYGEPSLNQISFQEDMNLCPITDYGKEKEKAEKIIKTFSESNDVDYLIYRLPMVYGKNMNSNVAKLFKIIDKSIPFLYFKGTNSLKKSFLSISNIKKIIHYNIENTKSINNNIYNISDNMPLSLNEFLEIYRKTTNSKSLLIKLPYIFFKILLKIPILKRILIKLLGNFIIDNKKFISLNNVKIDTTIEGIESLKNI